MAPRGPQGRVLVFPGLPHRPGQDKADPQGGQHAAVQEGGQIVRAARFTEHGTVHLPSPGRVIQAEPAVPPVVPPGPEQVQRQLHDADVGPRKSPRLTATNTGPPQVHELAGHPDGNHAGPGTRTTGASGRGRGAAIRAAWSFKEAL